MRNVRFGDRDSLGLFQQRPSQGWGTPEQILDPEYSTNRFYDALVKVDGYTEMNIAEAAQAVQRSAAGEAYAQHESQARVTASVLSGQTAEGIGCALEDPESAGDPDALVTLIDKDFAVPAEVEGSTVTVPVDSEELAWAVGSWAVARAADTGAVRVVVGDREWRRSMEESAFEWGTGGRRGRRPEDRHHPPRLTPPRHPGRSPPAARLPDVVCGCAVDTPFRRRPGRDLTDEVRRSRRSHRSPGCTVRRPGEHDTGRTGWPAGCAPPGRRAGRGPRTPSARRPARPPEAWPRVPRPGSGGRRRRARSGPRRSRPGTSPFPSASPATRSDRHSRSTRPMSTPSSSYTSTCGTGCGRPQPSR